MARGKIDWENPDAVRKYNREWGQKHREQLSVRTSEVRYGLEKGGYNSLFEKQKGCCAICGKHQLQFKQRLGVDHDHKTKQIRELLCKSCNLLLGYAEDDLERLEAAKQYLLKHRKALQTNLKGASR